MVRIRCNRDVADLVGVTETWFELDLRQRWSGILEYGFRNSELDLLMVESNCFL